MNSEVIKLFSPIVFFALWGLYTLRIGRVNFAGAALFFTSIVACSQNFSFMYREMHQIIQAVMSLVALMYIILSWRVLKINKIFAGLMFFVLISLLLVPIDLDAKAQLVNILSVLGVVNFLYICCDSYKALDEIADYFVVLAVVLAVIGILEYAFAPGTRSEASMSNPNYFGYFLGLGFCIASVRLAGVRRLVAITLMVLGILACGSRSAFALPVMQIAWTVYRSGSFRKMVAYAVVCTSVIVLILASGVTRFSDSEASQGSDAERLIFAGIAYKMAMDRPYTGVGWGRFISEFGKYSTSAESVIIDSGTIDVSSQDRRVTHNDFLRILAELGWGAFLASIVVCFNGLYTIFKYRSFNVHYLFGVWCGTVWFSLTHNNLNSGFFWFFFLMPFFLYYRSQSRGALESRLCLGPSRHMLTYLSVARKNRASGTVG